jgi:hypothetical protein
MINLFLSLLHRIAKEPLIEERALAGARRRSIPARDAAGQRRCAAHVRGLRYGRQGPLFLVLRKAIRYRTSCRLAKAASVPVAREVA